MLAMVSTALVATAETAYVGQLGNVALAALALVFPMIMLQQMMSGGAMGGGISSAISRALGAGDQVRANALAMHAVLIGLVAGILFSLLFLLFGRPIYMALGGRGAVLETALVYSNTLFVGVTSVWLTNTLASILRGTGNMRAPSATLFLSALAQVLLGGILGLGWFGAPRLGILGVGIAYVAASLGATIALAAILIASNGPVRLRLVLTGLDQALFRDILKVGAIAIVSPVQSVLTVLITTRLIAARGTEALAGYGIGARLEFLLVPIVFAIGVASVPMVGMAIGAGRVERARRVAWIAATSGAVIVGVLGSVVALLPHLWTGYFSSDPSVVAAASAYFRVAGPAYAFYGFGLALYFASQGSGKIIGPVLAQTARLLVIALGGMALALDAPVEHVFALVGLAMVTYGLASALALRLVRW
jgi:putative MATE family efflux protein